MMRVHTVVPAAALRIGLGPAALFVCTIGIVAAVLAAGVVAALALAALWAALFCRWILALPLMVIEVAAWYHDMNSLERATVRLQR